MQFPDARNIYNSAGHINCQGVVTSVLLNCCFNQNKSSSSIEQCRAPFKYPTMYSSSLKQIIRNMVNPFTEATNHRHGLHEKEKRKTKAEIRSHPATDILGHVNKGLTRLWKPVCTFWRFGRVKDFFRSVFNTKRTALTKWSTMSTKMQNYIRYIR